MKAYKVDVSQGMSKEVQLHAFSLGYQWEYDQCKVNDRFTPCHLHSHYLYFNKDGSIWYSDDKKYFLQDRENWKISVEDFLKISK
jgi:hypothetical protein